MAAETILGAVLDVVLDRLASKEVIDLFKSTKINQSLVDKLKQEMHAAGKVLADAEQKQSSDINVKEWLSDLKHLFYRAEEIADKIATEAVRSSMDQSPKKVRFVRNLIPAFSSSSSFASSINSEIREVDGLEHMVSRSTVLKLSEGSANDNTTLNNRETSSYVEQDYKVFGRDKVKEDVLNSLFSEEAEKNKICGVAIVGMGGMGKTTLAQSVYNHERLKTFDLKGWVYISQQFNVSQIIKSIIQSITGKPYNGSPDLQALNSELTGILRERRFFLVLDDVWNEKPEEWESVRTPLSYGAHGSKFIVTTRNDKVADIMDTTHVIRLKPLLDEDGWSLFSKRAASANENLQSNPRKEEIGRKIVHKCQGLPLAIKAIGGLLRPKKDIRQWEEILQSPMWELLDNKSNVAPALMLSYYHLPSHLKRCFSYCAIFPKGYKFDRTMLVLLWMAENFVVKPRDSGRRIEDIGEEYLNQLLSRSFFDGLGDCVVMHDLMHDLAQAVSGEFFARLEFEDKASRSNKKTRHFSFSQEYVENSTRFEGLHETAKYLRTFIPLSLEQFGCDLLSDKIPTQMIPHFHCLHVLSLSRYNVLNIPESIGDLMQLRYLDVSKTLIEELPESVSNLCNLQTLLLPGCRNLKRLPAHLSRVVSLRHLDIRGTSSLDQMPKHIGKLTCLQTLSGFVVGKDRGHGIEELRDLVHIRGNLALRHLQNVSSPSDALEANLSCKSDIKELALVFDGKDNDVSETGRLVVENLKPHTNLERLTIENYPGTRFPSWIDSQCSLYINLVNLCLKGCKYCRRLPPLGHLPSLGSLEIVGMDHITAIGSEFYYSDGSSAKVPFLALRTIKFSGMKNWKAWSGHEIEGRVLFPCLESLTICDCPELEGDLPVNVLSLKELHIERCDRLESSVLQLSSINYELQSASIQRALGNLSSQLASITNLTLDGLQQLVRLPPEVSMLDCLKTLGLKRCENLKSLDNVALPCNLRKLEIQVCKILECLPKEMDLLNHLLEIKLWGCPCLKSGPEDTLPTSLQSLSVGSCESWEFPIPAERMERYSALDHLFIHGGPLISFPLGGFPKLRSLTLWYMRDLERVYIRRGADDLINLTSLEDLIIKECRKLKWVGKIEEEGVIDLPAPNLESLSITGCENVKPLLLLSGSGVADGEGLPSKLQSLEIDVNHDKITPHTNCRSLLMFSCLTQLRLYGYSGEYFPDNEGPLPTSITHLRLDNFPDLKRLNGEALQTLSSLRVLSILKCPNLECLPEVGLPPSLCSLYLEECPKLQCLPKVGLPPSLGRLYISGCPKLEERCREKKGLDWPIIKHIPHIEINDKSIIL